MEIQKVIKQSKFESSNQKAFINLIYTFNHIVYKQNKIFKKHDILSQHYNVLKIIKGRYPQPATPKSILEVMLDKGRDLTRLVDKLVTLGYVKREIDTENKRSIQISLTDSGLQFTKRVEEEINKWMNQNITMSEDEAELLSTLLDKMRG